MFIGGLTRVQINRNFSKPVKSNEFEYLLEYLVENPMNNLQLLPKVRPQDRRALWNRQPGQLLAVRTLRLPGRRASRVRGIPRFPKQQGLNSIFIRH